MFHLYHSLQIIYVEHYFGDSFAISWQGMKFSSAIFLSVFFYWLYYTNDAKFIVALTVILIWLLLLREDNSPFSNCKSSSFQNVANYKLSGE